MPQPHRIAFFVSPHGFGHAARAAAVVAALRARLPSLEVDLWTSVPRWFFEESLGGFPFRFNEFACDVGLAQKSPVEEDLSASVAALERLWSGEAEKARTREAVSELVADGVDLVLCDIAPLGLEIARQAGLPSVLLESFTWDWIYEPLVEIEPGFAKWVSFLREKLALADLHLQLDPVCAPWPGAPRIPPIARAPQRSRQETRARLEISHGGALVLVSLGGVEHRLENVAPLFENNSSTFVLLGASEREEKSRNVRLLPHHSPIYHPDLVAAADLVVGKLGYSTVAEVVAAGTRLLYVPRPGFRESAVLERYVQRLVPADEIAFAELESGAWARRAPEMLRRTRPAPRTESGAAMAADAILRFHASRAG